jgi:hypothetical protein
MEPLEGEVIDHAYFQITDQNSEFSSKFLAKLCRLFDEMEFYVEKYIK